MQSHDNRNSQTSEHSAESEEEAEKGKANSEPLLTLQDTTIRDVFKDNFEQEMQTFMKLVETYNCISMDTEFPGINIANEYVQWVTPDQAEHEYHVIKQNVDNSRIIQIGLTLADEQGRVPQGICTWQFNFEFLLEQDIINSDSHNLLTRAGISFQRLKEKGISVNDFSEYLVASGVLLNPRVKWVVFHGGYDFAYLLKMVHGEGLPESSQQFYDLMKLYYPNVCDLKYYIKDVPNLKGSGLAKLASKIRCRRIGPPHQAGSDSLLTMCCYFKLKQLAELESALKSETYINILYGIGRGYIKSNTPTNYVSLPYLCDPPQPYIPYPPYYYLYPQELYYFYPQPPPYPQPYLYPDTYQQ